MPKTLGMLAGVALIAAGIWYYARQASPDGVGLGFGVRPDPFGGGGSDFLSLLSDTSTSGPAFFDESTTSGPAPAAAASPAPEPMEAFNYERGGD